MDLLDVFAGMARFYNRLWINGDEQAMPATMNENNCQMRSPCPVLTATVIDATPKF